VLRFKKIQTLTGFLIRAFFSDLWASRDAAQKIKLSVNLLDKEGVW
jgi:hypothetical protein